MKNCINCGVQIPDEADICPNCRKSQTEITERDSKSFGVAILCFFFPVIGLVLNFMLRNEQPLKAKSAAKGAIIGVIVCVVIALIMLCLESFLSAAEPTDPVIKEFGEQYGYGLLGY